MHHPPVTTVIYVKSSLLCLIIITTVAYNSFSQTDIAFWEEQTSGEELPLLLQGKDAIQASDLGYDLYNLMNEGWDSFRHIFQDTLASSPQFQLNYRFLGTILHRQVLKSEFSPVKSLEFHFLAENDPQENWGDFTAYNLTFKANNFKVIGGHYSAGFGQGLVLWRGFEWHPFPEVPIAPLKHDFLNGYQSTAENSALYGGGITYNSGSASAILIYSDSRLDAHSDDDGVTSLLTSGEHITPSQIADKDRLREKLWGAHFKINVGDYFSGGISATSAHYAPPFASSDDTGEEFDFAGAELRVMGADFIWKYGAMTLASEMAKTSTAGFGAVSRMLFRSTVVSGELELKYLSPKFQNLRSLYPQGNERGYRLALSLKPWQTGRLNASYQVSEKIWRTIQYQTPPCETDEALSLEQKIGANSLTLRLRETTNGEITEESSRQQIRLTARRELKNIQTALRMERMLSNSEAGIECGYLASGNVGGKFFKGDTDLAISYFKIPDWDCRIYLYEPDIPGNVSVSAFQGNGWDINLVYKVRLTKHFTGAGRAGETFYSWRNDQPGGDVNRTFSIFLEYRF